MTKLLVMMKNDVKNSLISRLHLLKNHRLKKNQSQNPPRRKNQRPRNLLWMPPRRKLLLSRQLKKPPLRKPLQNLPPRKLLRKGSSRNLGVLAAT